MWRAHVHSEAAESYSGSMHYLYCTCTCVIVRTVNAIGHINTEDSTRVSPPYSGGPLEFAHGAVPVRGETIDFNLILPQHVTYSTYSTVLVPRIVKLKYSTVSTSPHDMTSVWLETSDPNNQGHIECAA